ncbi:unnamed protein product [Paramecium pentaurelia]|uniref:Uncharacterized protein n=1 Tax=Paramecium pentaurelia TaxID=43138 RepID=A0A8S1WP53_9CILI|nr:unnamed protein product [Paramecium pentaurelia]
MMLWTLLFNIFNKNQQITKYLIISQDYYRQCDHQIFLHSILQKVNCQTYKSIQLNLKLLQNKLNQRLELTYLNNELTTLETKAKEDQVGLNSRGFNDAQARLDFKKYKFTTKYLDYNDTLLVYKEAQRLLLNLRGE